MSSFKVIKGDLIALAKQGEFDVIVHGVNCQSLMGAGIALQIKKEFPGAYLKDKNDLRHPLEKLGNLTSYYNTEYKVNIINLYTQLYPGRNADYIAIECSLLKLKLLGIIGYKTKIGIPLIGCGIGGLEWEKVELIIKRVLSEYDVTIVIYDK